MTTITTKYGEITENVQDFGYGTITVSNGAINYVDSDTNKAWKTAKAFEKWADKMAHICGRDVFGKVEPHYLAPLGPNMERDW